VAVIVSPALTLISLAAFDLVFEAATLLQDIIERGNRLLPPLPQAAHERA
jgi:hypothetical protein